MNILISIFRLTTGNRVDWYFGEALEVPSARVVERIHKDAVTGPFSKTIRFSANIPLLGGLISAFFSDDCKPIKQDDLRKLIDYFVNCCDETSYLEARGLLASTLADLIVLTHAEVMDCQNVMEEEDFNTQVLPALQAAIGCIEVPGLSNQLRKRALQELKGAYRQTFRNRLKLLVKKTNLSLNPEDRGRAVNIRNELVHKGKFLSENRNDWYGEYSFMIWLDFVTLCRLSGYDGELPQSIVVSAMSADRCLGEGARREKPWKWDGWVSVLVGVGAVVQRHGETSCRPMSRSCGARRESTPGSHPDWHRLAYGHSSELDRSERSFRTVSRVEARSLLTISFTNTLLNRLLGRTSKDAESKNVL